MRRATAAGVQFVNQTMTDADSLAVVTIGTRLTVVKDCSGLSLTAGDVPTELRAATNACVRANVSIYLVDARGLRTAVASRF